MLMIALRAFMQEEPPSLPIASLSPNRQTACAHSRVSSTTSSCPQHTYVSTHPFAHPLDCVHRSRVASERLRPAMRSGSSWRVPRESGAALAVDCTRETSAMPLPKVLPPMRATLRAWNVSVCVCVSISSVCVCAGEAAVGQTAAADAVQDCCFPAAGDPATTTLAEEHQLPGVLQEPSSPPHEPPPSAREGESTAADTREGFTDDTEPTGGAAVAMGAGTYPPPQVPPSSSSIRVGVAAVAREHDRGLEGSRSQEEGEGASTLPPETTTGDQGCGAMCGQRGEAQRQVLTQAEDERGRGTAGSSRGQAPPGGEGEGAEKQGEEEDACRICRMGREHEQLFAPCACRGSMRWVTDHPETTVL